MPAHVIIDTAAQTASWYSLAGAELENLAHGTDIALRAAPRQVVTGRLSA